MDFLYWLVLARAVTWMPGIPASLLRTSSVTPSAKYSSSAAPSFSNGSTATRRRLPPRVALAPEDAHREGDDDRQHGPGHRKPGPARPPGLRHRPGGRDVTAGRAEGLGKFRRGGEAIRRGAGHGAGNRRRQRRGHGRAGSGEGPRRLGQHPGDDGLRAGAGERRLPGQQLVQHAAEGVDVAPAVDAALPAGLLRAHVGRRADRHAGPGQGLLAAGRAGDPEVGHQRLAVGEQDVLRLDVPVDDVVAMGVVQRQGRLPDDADRLVHRELDLAGEPVPQALALDERHGVPELTRGFSRVVHAQDVGVLEPGGELDLPLEALVADRRGQLGQLPP